MKSSCLEHDDVRLLQPLQSHMPLQQKHRSVGIPAAITGAAGLARFAVPAFPPAVQPPTPWQTELQSRMQHLRELT